MKKVYSNPKMYICCLESELLTLTTASSAENENIIFGWDDARSTL